MAIVSSMWLKGAKKRLGGTVIYQAMGQTRQRELAAEVSNPRTESQMGQRVKWANLVNLYRANRSWMKYAFETKKSNQSEYNKFMSLNVADSRIYLPKQVANAGGCVVDTYMITQGSLLSIEFIPTTNGYFRSNIEIYNGINLNTISVKDFSDMVVELNPAIRYGDQLSFIRMTQMTNGATGVPYVVVREYEVIIDTNNLLPFSNYFPIDLISTWGGGPTYLAVGTAEGRSGGFAMILSRTISGKTYVSSQKIIPVGMATYIEAFSSSEALQTAIDSYGVSQDAFLSSTYAAQDNQASTLLALLSVNYNNGDEEYTSWSRFVCNSLNGDDEFVFTFNGDLASAPSNILIQTNKGNIALESISKAGNSARGVVPASWTDSTNVVIISATVTYESGEYSILFRTQNSDFIQGIE